MRNAGKIMIVAAVATALAACSPSREAPSELPSDEQPVHTPASASVSNSASEGHSEDTHAGQADECTAEDITVDTSGQQPRVTIPHDCTPPSTVLDTDIESGVGATAEPGSRVVANLQVLGWSNGNVVLNTYETEEPRTIQLGQPHEIEGLNEALVDIKQSGTRLIVLPPDLGYSEQSGNPLAQDTVVIVATAVQVVNT